MTTLEKRLQLAYDKLFVARQKVEETEELIKRIEWEMKVNFV